MDQLSEAEPSDWLKPTKVVFIGEEGVDHGGLSREFFSLLFATSPVFEEESLSLNPSFIENRTYELMGKAVVIGVLNGHPGPKNLNPFITTFILKDEISKFRVIDDDYIKRADVKAIIEEIRNSEDMNLVFEKHMDTLILTGFSKQLTLSNREEAITALKGYFLLHRVMTPLLQFIEGLKFQNFLHVLRKYPADKQKILSSENSMCSAEEIIFFRY